MLGEILGTVMAIMETDSAVTKRVKNNCNEMSDQAFFNKYSVTKEQYVKRVEKYGDPYMNSPMSKLAKSLFGER